MDGEYHPIWELEEKLGFHGDIEAYRSHPALYQRWMAERGKRRMTVGVEPLQVTINQGLIAAMERREQWLQEALAVIRQERAIVQEFLQRHPDLTAELEASDDGIALLPLASEEQPSELEVVK